MTDVPISPSLGRGGRGRRCCGCMRDKKDPRARRERSLTHIVPPSGPAIGHSCNQASENRLCQSDVHVHKRTLQVDDAAAEKRIKPAAPGSDGGAE